METIISDQTFHFPEEILLEILVNLPPESIFTFKCVSKHFLSLISHASFSPFYISRSKNSLPFALVFRCDNRLNGFVVSTDNTFKIPSPLFPSDQIPGLKIDATSNDLILYESNRHESVYFVANPFTNSIVKLPRHSKRPSFGPTAFISSVENGITSYNVARLVQYYDNVEQHSLNVETFSSEKGEWTNLKVESHTVGLKFDARPCIAFKGALHWICNRMTTLLAYDDRGSCRVISIPNEAYHMSGKNAILGVCGENLCYFEMSRISIQAGKLAGWKMWVLRDYEKGGCWSVEREAKERKIESFGGLRNVLSMHSPLFPVAFHPWDSDVVYFWYEGYVLSFSVRTGWFSDKFSVFCSESSTLSTWEIFPLLMPLCSTRIDNVVAQVNADAE